MPHRFASCGLFVDEIQVESFGSWFKKTWVEVIRRPSKALGKPPEGNRFLLFGIVCASAGMLLNAVFETSLVTQTLGQVEWNREALSGLATLLGVDLQETVSVLVGHSRIYLAQKLILGFLYPVICFFSIHLLASAIYWPMRTLFQNGDAPITLDNVIALVALCQAPMVFAAIPVVGPLFAGLWVLVLLTLGLRSSLRIGFFFRVAVVFLPALMINMLWSWSLGLLAQNIPEDWVKSPLDRGRLEAVIAPEKIK